MFWHFTRVYALAKMNLSGEKLLKIHIDNEVLRLKSKFHAAPFRSVPFYSVRFGSIANYDYEKWMNEWTQREKYIYAKQEIPN